MKKQKLTKTIEFDKILEEMGRISGTQWIQIFLVMIPGMLAAMHMGANVFIGADIRHWCAFPLEDYFEKKCNETWAADQRAMYIPWNEELEQFSSCERYTDRLASDQVNCSYWWPGTETTPATTTTTTTTRSAVAVTAQTRQTTQCREWSYAGDDNFHTTIVSSFDLVCDDSHKRQLSQALFMVGVTVGASAWGQASDRRGRKFAIVAAGLLAGVASIAIAFVTSFALFLALRVFIGFVVFPPFSAAFVMGAELVPPKHRVRVAQSQQAMFAVGFCALALFGYLIRDWRTLQIALAIPLFTEVLFYWLLSESPRWLIAHGNYRRANQIVQKMLKGLARDSNREEVGKLENAANQQPVDDDQFMEETKTMMTDQHNDEEWKDHASSKYTPFDLVRLPNIRRKSIILFYCWLTSSCVYYGLTLNAADLGGDPFLNLMLSGLVEIPAAPITMLLMDKWGRRPTLCASLILAGVACVAMQWVPIDMRELNIFCSLTGKFGAAAAFADVYVYASEIYPTPIRNLGIGMCSSWARVGGILAPFIAMLSTVSGPLPYVVFGVMSGIGGLTCLFLPETVGLSLPETLAEGEAMGRDQTYPLELSACCGVASAGDEQTNLPPPPYTPVPESTV